MSVTGLRQPALSLPPPFCFCTHTHLQYISHSHSSILSHFTSRCSRWTVAGLSLLAVSLLAVRKWERFVWERSDCCTFFAKRKKGEMEEERRRVHGSLCSSWREIIAVSLTHAVNSLKRDRAVFVIKISPKAEKIKIELFHRFFNCGWINFNCI